MAMSIKTIKTTSPKQKPSADMALGFGNYFTDHMFVMKYDRENGWHDGQIVPYAPIPLDPAAMCLHYGQEVFEGLKAYLSPKGEVLLFRPEKNFERLNLSNERMCIPQLDADYAIEALKQLVTLDKDWIPTAKDSSLYIRPFIFAIDPHVGVRPANEYLFIIILSPVGSYYPQGLNPTKIYVETNYTRATKGGTGHVKAGANYAISLKAQQEASKAGYSQVLWLDAVEKKYVEEVGTSNIFFVIDGEVITPSLEGSVLSGITRMSCIELLRSWGMKVTERRISIEEVKEAIKSGKLSEAFATGTAAVISPVGELKVEDENYVIGGGKIGDCAQKLYDTLRGIQTGITEDKFGWSVKVD